MKKSNLLLFLPIALIVALASCSMEKRVYTSGYHIEWNHKNDILNINTAQSKQSQTINKIPENATIRIEGQAGKTDVRENTSPTFADLTAKNTVTKPVENKIINRDIKQENVDSKLKQEMKESKCRLEAKFQKNPRRGGSDWSFRAHPVRWILIGLLLVLIIVLFIVTGGQGYNSHGDGSV